MKLANISQTKQLVDVLGCVDASIVTKKHFYPRKTWGFEDVGEATSFMSSQTVEVSFTVHIYPLVQV